MAARRAQPDTRGDRADEPLSRRHRTGGPGPEKSGAALLAAYALGLGAAFLSAGVAFGRAMTTFRWLRDRYTVIQVVSGLILVALGLLLFFHRDWWLHVAVNRVLDGIGLTSP